MDAPNYPPAAAYQPPVALPYVLSLDNASIGELMNFPAAWAIVVKYVPSLKFMSGTAQLKPHLGNMTVPSLAVFSQPIAPQLAATINEELARLTPIQVSAP
jgi:hypothetical protein